jgi:hypothetical protein
VREQSVLGWVVASLSTEVGGAPEEGQAASSGHKEQRMANQGWKARLMFQARVDKNNMNEDEEQDRSG